MNQPQVLNTLDNKRREIEAHIGSLEQDMGKRPALTALRDLDGYD